MYSLWRFSDAYTRLAWAITLKFLRLINAAREDRNGPALLALERIVDEAKAQLTAPIPRRPEAEAIDAFLDSVIAESEERGGELTWIDP